MPHWHGINFFVTVSLQIIYELLDFGLAGNRLYVVFLLQPEINSIKDLLTTYKDVSFKMFFLYFIQINGVRQIFEKVVSKNEVKLKNVG